MTRALVTGGGGFLGLHIVKLLRERGDDVVVCGRNTYQAVEDLGARSVQADIRDLDAIKALTKDVDQVYHVAALAGIWGPWRDYYQTNYVGTQHVIEACIAGGVSKLIYTSSPSVIFEAGDQSNLNEDTPYPDAYLAHYPRSKAMAERAVLEANGRNGLYTVSLRPHLIWGPGDRHLIPRIVSRARAGQLRQVGSGENRVDVIYVENAARAHLQAAEAIGPKGRSNGKTYFINQDQPVNLWDFVGQILERAGAPAVTKSLSFKQAYRIGAGLEFAYKLLGKRKEPRMTRFLACELASDHFYDSSRARRDFGYAPTVSTEEGLRRLFAEDTSLRYS